MRISRRLFCAGVGAASLTGQFRRLAFGADSKPFELRVFAYNILKGTGWPADRGLARQAVASQQMMRRIALELALYEPHLVTFSESPDESATKQAADLLGMNHIRFPSGESWPGTLLTKFDVIESRNAPVASGVREADLFTRHWGRATLRLPDGKPLIVHSAHLHPSSDSAIRLREIDAMLAAMRDDLQEGKPALLMGDLNHRPASPEYAKWKDGGWIDTFAAVGQGDGNTFPASGPRGRIDYVWVAGPLTQQIKASRPLFVGAFRTNPADDNSFALSDHVPQYAAFELR